MKASIGERAFAFAFAFPFLLLDTCGGAGRRPSSALISVWMWLAWIGRARWLKEGADTDARDSAKDAIEPASDRLAVWSWVGSSQRLAEEDADARENEVIDVASDILLVPILTLRVDASDARLPVPSE